MEGKKGMIQINLLPWRQQARLAKKKRLISAAIVFAVFTLFIILLCHLYISAHLNQAEESTNYLQAQINQEQIALNDMSNQEQERNTVKSQLYFIKNLIIKNYRTVGLLNELIKVVPTNITINRIIRSGSSIAISGIANSDEDITLFIQALAKSSYFKQPTLTLINQKSTSGNKEFEIGVEQRDSISP